MLTAIISQALQGLFVPGAMKYQLSKLGHSQIKAKIIWRQFWVLSDTSNSRNLPSNFPFLRPILFLVNTLFLNNSVSILSFK